MAFSTPPKTQMKRNLDAFSSSSLKIARKAPLAQATDDISALAAAEGFTAHANAVTIRKD